MTMRVLGVPQLLGRFAKTAIAAQAATKVGQAEVAQEVEEGAKQRVPVVTGTLQDSIHAEADRVAVDAPYASYVEFGTSRQAAEAYLRPAADEVQGSTAERLMLRIVGSV